MSSSRSPDDKDEQAPAAERKKSPGRYSLADEGDAVPPTRIDSTTRMPAVRPDLFLRGSAQGAPVSSREPLPPRPPSPSSPDGKAPASVPQPRPSQRGVPPPLPVQGPPSQRGAPPPLPVQGPPSQRGAGAEPSVSTEARGAPQVDAAASKAPEANLENKPVARPSSLF
ncbi:MAG TPA: hypothetical protein VM580_24685, partial [Labilithrix sp.]|nr:hypothetical protein [Labilithrix sp.]